MVNEQKFEKEYHNPIMVDDKDGEELSLLGKILFCGFTFSIIISLCLIVLFPFFINQRENIENFFNFCLLFCFSFSTLYSLKPQLFFKKEYHNPIMVGDEDGDEFNLLSKILFFGFTFFIIISLCLIVLFPFFINQRENIENFFSFFLLFCFSFSTLYSLKPQLFFKKKDCIEKIEKVKKE